MTTTISGTTGVSKVDQGGTSLLSLDTEMLERVLGGPWITGLAYTHGSILTFQHGITKGVPSRLRGQLVCQTAEFGWSPGDVMEFYPGTHDASSGNSYGSTLVFDATNVTLYIGTTGFVVANKATRALSGLTAANWRLNFKAYL